MDDVKYVLREDSKPILSLNDLQALIWKRKKVIGLVGVVAFIVAFVAASLQPDYYVVRRTLSSSMFGYNEIEPQLDNIVGYIHENKVSKLVEVFDIDTVQASSIRSIEFVNGLTNGGLYTVEMIVDVTDTSIIDALQIGTINSLVKNEYLKRRFDLRKKQYESILAASELEFEELRAFKQETKGLGDKIQKGIVVYPLNTHSEILKVQEKMASLKNQLDLLSIAEFITDAEAPSRPNGPKALNNAIIATVISMLICIAVFIGHKLLTS